MKQNYRFLISPQNRQRLDENQGSFSKNLQQCRLLAAETAAASHPELITGTLRSI